jgi:hypothetical protein
MNDDLLATFLESAYFNQNVGYLKATQTALYGRQSTIYTKQLDREVVILNATSHELQNLGIGQFMDKQSFWVYSNEKFGLADLIIYNGDRYKRINSQDWTAYGFNRYIFSIYNEETLL